MKRTLTLLRTLLPILVVIALATPTLAVETFWDAVADGGFELGSPNPNWNETSQHTGQVIWNDPSHTHTGNWSAQFGSSYPVPEVASLSQDITLGTGSTTISFWWTRPNESENNEDVICLKVDGNVVWSDVPYPGIGQLDTWLFHSADISPLADGGIHQISFEMTSSGTSGTGDGTLWYIDDVEVQTSDSEDLQADFYWEPAFPMVGEIIQFWNTSTGEPDLWYWDFGDGQFSELKDPIHVFENAGIYPVSLTAVRTSDNAESTYTLNVTIQEEPLSVDFSWLPLVPTNGETTSFNPVVSGNPDEWMWDFGDGNESNEVSPEHIYDAPGEYMVVLDVYRSSDGADGSAQHLVTVREPLFPEFIWDPEAPGVGETVSLTDVSTGDPDWWYWDFGDGFNSDEQDPTHIWDEAGDYEVTLTISRSDDPETAVTHMVTISGDDVEASFVWDPLQPEVGEEVWFTDTSTGDPDLWFWTFGEDDVSDEQNPAFIFNRPGEHLVSLTVSRSDAPNLTSTIENTVTVLPTPIVAWFEWWPEEPIPGTEVEFFDASEGEPAEWQWSFGDGSSSTEQNPIHTYSDSGAFDVTLVVTDPTGVSDEITQQLFVRDDLYVVDFSWLPEDPHAGEAVEFNDLSSGGQAWYWDFGDGRNSRQQHPVHWYNDAGSFEVTLTVAFDVDGTILRSKTQTVIVAPPPLEADFFWVPLSPSVGETVAFTDVSRGRPTAWFWEFGDGASSEDQHPEHEFDAPGQYTVTLTIERVVGKALATDTKVHTVHVTPGVEIDFSWDPEEPRALDPVRFTEEIDTVDEPVGSRFWSFGDSGTTHVENPTHTFQRPGRYSVQLWVADADGNILATAEHEITVHPPDLDLELGVSNNAPHIGEAVTFHLSGIDTVETVQWTFGGIGCNGSDGHASCIPTENDDCLTRAFTYATAGPKPARIWIRAVGGVEMGPFGVSVQVGPGGQCSEPPLADFRWWPAAPKAGQPVRCVDISVGPPETWAWSFDDGSTSPTQHATHIFETAGQHLVELAISNSQGQSTVTRTITVDAANAICGNDVCEPGETSWSCPQDCLDDPTGTGRGGRKNANLVVPAAVGGIAGANGTFWLTEGSIVNPGEEDAQVVVEFVADNDPDTPHVAGPATIPPRTAIHFDNVVWQLFGTHSSGSLWIDADKPVIANTRTFNQSGEATFGQGIGGITKNDVLGEGDGSVYVIGLKQNQRFRTNFLLQEVSGQTATVQAEIFDSTGESIGAGTITVPAKTKWQKSITELGIQSLDAGYAVLSVVDGGRIAAMASVIDQVTGDATSIDAVHTFQTGTGGPAKAGADEDEASHFLVAVVARTPGANNTVWRSEVSILNSEESDQVLELRYLPSNGEMLTATRELAAGELFFSENVIEEVFPEAPTGAGSLHVFAQKGLVVNSRTYNVLPDESTVGQAIPGLSNGDMARTGEIWLLDSLKQTDDFRCNLGFAEYEGTDTEVTVVLFDTGGASLFFLASKKYTVPALGQFQVNKVFQDMGLSGQFSQAIAYVSVNSEGGGLYVYASIVDNSVGDGTTVLGKRQ